MKTLSLSFIGGGRITRIFLRAFANKKIVFKAIYVFDPDPLAINTLKEDFSDIIVTAKPEEAAKQDVVFLAVHPPIIMNVLDQLKNSIPDRSIIISLAPKITIKMIEEATHSPHVIRLIPNATSIINQGFNPVCFADNFNDLKKEEMMKVLLLLGQTINVTEEKLEGYALISAMLPTYFWFQWETILELGQEMGLSKSESKVAIKQTLNSAINLLFDSEMKTEEVIDLIPVKPIKEHEEEIKHHLSNCLLGVFNKIKPT